jgi:hypothetical protein
MICGFAVSIFDNRGHDILPNSSQGRRLKEMSRRDLPDSVVRFGSERHSQAKILPEQLLRIDARLSGNYIVQRRQSEAAWTGKQAGP